MHTYKHWKAMDLPYAPSLCTRCHRHNVRERLVLILKRNSSLDEYCLANHCQIFRPPNVQHQ